MGVAIPSGARGDLPSQAEDAIISLFLGKVLDNDLATDSDGMNICEAALHVNLPLQSLIHPIVIFIFGDPRSDIYPCRFTPAPTGGPTRADGLLLGMTGTNRQTDQVGLASVFEAVPFTGGGAKLG